MKKLVIGAAGALALIAAAALFLRIRSLKDPLPRQVPTTEPRERGPLKVTEVVYDAGLGKGWDDFGWGPRGPREGGVLRVGFSGFGGIIFRHAELTSQFGALVFRYRAPESFGLFLRVSLRSSLGQAAAFPLVTVERGHVIELPGGWTEAVVPWSALNPASASFDQIVIEARDLVGADWVEIDKVGLTDGGGSPVRAGKLSVDCRGKATRISPLIFGLAQDSKGAGEAALRFGGNRMSRFNWERPALNTGSDWFFRNVSEKTGPFTWLESAARDDKHTAIVVPTIGWVAKDGTSVGFPTSKFGQQRARDPSGEAGDGHQADGTPIAPGPPTQTSVAAPPELIQRWIARVRKQDAALGARSVDLYILDNEPDLWHVTHRDVHPEPLTYDELLDRTIRYGTAIREADPEGKIAGPASWGWPGYFYSAMDVTAPRWRAHPDRRSHGDVPLLPWYLQQLAEHERRTKMRLLDVLNVHYYPQAPGICQGAKTDAATSALRIRSTRALWDPEYRDESWINDRVRLLPRLQEWVDRNYPGRQISLGEWSFCAEEHISGGLAIAEALGRFAQHGLYAAFFWGSIKTDTPAFWAYRAYRNFDGQGARFADWSLPTQADSELSLFASRNDAGTRLVAIVLNLDPTHAVEATVDVSSCGAVTARRVFTYAAGYAGIRPSPPSTDAGQESRFAPYSITILDLAIDKASQR